MKKSDDQAARDKAMRICHRMSGFNVFSLPDEHLLAVNFVEILIEKNREYTVVHDADNQTVTYFW